MGLVETEGLILKCYSLAEADKIVLLLTRDHGLVRGVAKGAKRLKSRFGGGLEPFSIVNITYFQKEERELVSVQQIDLLTSFFGLAGEPGFQETFAYLGDLLAEFAQPNDPDERLFRMARKCLEATAADPGALSAVAVYFELWLLRLSGYLPDWSRCEKCGESFGVPRESFLQINFQLRCASCRKAARDPLVPAGERRVFSAALKLPPDGFAAQFRDRVENLAAVSIVLKRIISQVLGREVSGERPLAAKSRK